MRPVLLGSFAAAIAAFVIGFLFWGLAPFTPFTSAPDEAAAREALAAFPAQGAYMVPDANGDDYDAMVAAARQGYGLLFVRPEGVDMASPVTMALGFLVMWGAAFLLALLLSTAVRVDRGWAWRAAFVLCVGGTATMWSTLGLAVWWHLPWSFPGLNVVYDLVAFAAMGAVLATFFTGTRAAPNSRQQRTPALGEAR